jgi:hypothetical protein
MVEGLQSSITNMWTGKGTLTFFPMERAKSRAKLLGTSRRVVASRAKLGRTTNESHHPMQTMILAPSGNGK